MTMIEVSADVGCPSPTSDSDGSSNCATNSAATTWILRVRARPLEIVNGQPLDPHFIAEEVDDIRRQIAPTCSKDSTKQRPRWS